MVIGGGDSAVEAALALHNAGAEVELLYRSSTLYKASAPNRQKLIQAEANGLKRSPSTTVLDIRKDGLQSSNGVHSADAIFTFLGHQPPHSFLSTLNIQSTNHAFWWKPIWLTFFFALTVLYYGLKSGQSLLCSGCPP